MIAPSYCIRTLTRIIFLFFITKLITLLLRINYIDVVDIKEFI